MDKPKYTAGLHFIVSGSDLTLTKQERRAIRSHTSRAQRRSRKAAQLRSWISPERSLELVKEAKSQGPRFPSVTSLRGIGGDFSGLQLPRGIEPFMVQDLVKLIKFDSEGVYPYEVCLQVHPVERGWFPYVISDICCIHSMMFSVRAFVDGASDDGQISRQAAFHMDQTLQLLQARLDAFEQGQRDGVLCDSTIMVVIFLATAAELMGDFVAVKNHIDGLLEIIKLRGGLKSLHTHNNLQVKVCRYVSTSVYLHQYSTELLIPDADSRADVGLAMRSGNRARLFREAISWDCYIANRGVIRCSHEPYTAQIHSFVDILDPKIDNCWKDLHAFSCMSNLAYQTTRKLSPHTYSEMMISILYRLLHLSFEADSPQEAIRTGLLTFSSTLFMTCLYMSQPYERLFTLFSSALFKLCQSTNISLPPPILLWLMVLYHMVAYKQPSPSDWQSIQLGRAILLTRVRTWPQARHILKATMWVDFVHDVPGKKVFEAAVQRLDSRNEFDIRCVSI